MNTLAVVLNAPRDLALRSLALSDAGDADVTVAVEWSGISSGTERLLWSGRMPHFPGMGYPLVPGYESVGRIVRARRESGRREGERVFVPGANCFGDVRGLFGGAAATVVLPGRRVVTLDASLGEDGVLLALAATAHHAIGGDAARLPELIVGHGVLGRLLARLVQSRGGAPTVWETNPARRGGATGYAVVDPADDPRRDYRTICDASGDAALLDTLISRLAPGGEVVLAGFYDTPLSFVFAPAFLREARIRVAAQWQPGDLDAVRDLTRDGRLSLAGLVSHRAFADAAPAAYAQAFEDPDCLKMVLDWSHAP